MENTEKKEFEFSLVWFLETFKGKFKILVTVGIIASILGGTLGVLNVTAGEKIYGNTLAFYFPTPEQTGYANVIQLLESDLFTENVLIGSISAGEKEITNADGEKEKVTINIPDLDYTEEQKKEVIAQEFAKLQQTENIKALKDELKELPFELNLLKSELNEVKNKYSSIISEYDRLHDIQSDKLVTEAGIAEKITQLLPKYNEATKEIEELQNKYDSCDKLLKEKEAALFEAEKALEDATEKSEEIITDLRALWIANAENRKLVEDFHENVTYSFTKDGTPVPTTNASKENTSGKFLYINVKIPDDAKLANTIITNILAQIDGFVISNTTPLEKNDEIKCVRISSGDAKNINDESLISSVAKFAIIAFCIAEALTFAIIIVAQLKRTFFPDDDKKTVTVSAAAADNTDESADESSNENNDQ